MWRIMILTFGALAWAFWEMSGGGEFVPVERPARQIAAAAAAAEASTAPEEPQGSGEDATTSGTLVRASANQPTSDQGATSELITPVAATIVASQEIGADNEAGAAAQVGQTIGDAVSAAADLPDDALEPDNDKVVLFQSLAEGAPSADILPANRATSGGGKVLEVSGDRVNMRGGPGTDFNVLDTLPRGTRAEVLEIRGDGWARVKILDTGTEGWMADWLLQEF